MKSEKFFLTVIASILFSAGAFAQPAWVAGTPAVNGITPFSININYGINATGTVYIIVYNFNNTAVLTSGQVRAAALAGPAGGRIAVAILPVAAGDVDKVLARLFSSLPPGTNFTFYIVAENTAGTLQAAPVRLTATTPPCPPIRLKTFFGNLGECVNISAQGMYDPDELPPLASGVLAGTTWFVDWGDGNTWSYTSAFDNDIPAPQIHDFTNISDCAYVGTWVVKNPCNQFLSGTGVFVVHGREIDTDGDGQIEMEEPVSGDNNITYVCEGQEHKLNIRDITTWNCQSPDVPSPLNPDDYDNDSPRNMQFVYGETPDGTTIRNTITGNVLVGASVANSSNGVVGPVLGPVNPPNPEVLSDLITIPATCKDGERFYVYLKYWNKCNPFIDENLDYVDDYFIIEVVNAPVPPGVVSPQTYCFGDVPPTITATKINSSYVLNWYGDAAMTNFLFSGNSLTHGMTAVGTYDFYVTQSAGVNGCESPPARIDLVIIPAIGNNTIAADQSICYNTVPNPLTGSLPNGGNNTYTYRWEVSTTSSSSGFSTAPGTNNTRNYAPLTAHTTTTWYRRAVLSGPCVSYSNAIEIEVYNPVTAGSIASAQTICYNTTPAALTTGTSPSGGTGTFTYQWQISSDNSTWSNISGATGTTYSPGALTATTYYRKTVINTCGSVNTASVRILVMAEQLPGTIGSDQGICYGTAPSTLTNITFPSGGDGTFSYRWQYSTDGTTWNNITSGGTSANYSPGTLTANRYYRRRVTDGNCGYVYSAPVLITVFDEVTAGTIGTAQTVCYNTAPSELTELTVPTGGTGSYTYQWQVSTNGSSFSNISGATGVTYTPGALTANRYFRRVATSGTCGSVYSNSILITVYSALTAGTIAADQSICYNTTPATLTQATAPTGGTGTYTYQWQISSNNSTWVNLTGATSASYTPGSLTVTRYYRRNVNSGTCGTASSPSVKITVYPQLTPGSIGSDQTICYNTIPASITELTPPSGGSGVYSYEWQRSTDGVNWITIPGAIFSSYTPGALTVPTYFRRSITSYSCATVYSSPVLISLYSTLTLAQLNSDKSICDGTSTTFFVEITGGTAPYTINYTRNGVNQTAITNYTSGTPVSTGVLTTGSYVYALTSVTDSHGCQSQSLGTTITIIAGTIPTSATFTGNGDLCYNSSGYLTSTITGGGTPYTLNITGYSGSPVIGYNSGDIIDLGVLTPGTYSYTLTSLVDDCGKTLTAGLPKTHTFTVFAQLTGGTIAASQTICYNTLPASFTNTLAPSGGTALAYQWQKSPAGSGIWSNISGATGLAYTEITNLTASTDYRRVTTSGNSCGTVYSNIITVTVYPELTAGSIGTAQSICYNNIPAGLTQTGAPTGGTGTYSFTWERSTNGTTWNIISGATSSTYSPGALTTSSYYRRSVTSGSCGTVNSAPVLITVYGELTPGSVGSDQTICYNTIPSTLTAVTAPTGGTGTYSYQWQISLNNSTWSNISGATSATYSPGALTATRYYRRNVTSGTCGTVSSASVMITVYPELAAGSVGNNQSICYNTTPATLTGSTAPTGGTGTYTYLWQISSNNTIWSDISGATSSSYSPGALTGNTYYRRSVTSGTCGTVYSGSVLITVYPDFTPGTIGSEQTLCYNTAPAALTELTTPVGGTGTYAFLWQSSSDNSNWSDISGATSSTYSPGNLTSDTYFRRSVRSGICGPIYSNSVLISVYSILTPGSVGSPQSICYGTVPSGFTELAPPTGGTGIYTYQWQISSNNSTWVNLTGETSATYAPGALSVTRYYRRNVTSESCGTVSSASIEIFVYANLTPGSVGSPQSICYNTAPAALTELTAPTGGPGAYSFQWQSSTDNSSWADVFSATSASYNPGALTANTYFRRNVTSGTCATVSSASVLITVYPVLTPGTVESDQTICENAAPAPLTELTSATGGPGTYTYMWKMSTDNTTWSDISGATSTGYSPGGLSVNTYYRRNVTGGSCGTVSSDPVLITVTPLPVIADQSASVCSGANLYHNILLDNYTNPADNVTFTWPAPTLSAGLTGGTDRVAPSADPMEGVFINLTGNPQTATYYVTPYYAGCSGATKTIVVTIGSQPILADLDMSVCSDQPSGLTLAVASGSVAAGTYNVLNITVDPDLTPAAGNVTAANGVAADYLSGDIFTNITGVDQTVIYNVQPVYGGACLGDAKDIIVTVHPKPVIAPDQTMTVCSNVTADMEILLLPANLPAGTLLSWGAPVMSDGSSQGSAASNISAGPAGTIHISELFVNHGAAPIDALYSVIPVSADGCTGNSVDVVITVNPEPDAPAISGDDKLCAGDKSIVYSVPVTPGSTYTWSVPASVGAVIFDVHSNAIVINAAATAGTGTITVTETNSYGCTGLAGTYDVTVVAPSPVSPILGDNPVCENETANYSVPAVLGSVYTWTLPSGTALLSDPTQAAVTVIFGSASGDISVREVNSAGCITDHGPLTITVNPLPTVVVNNPAPVCSPATVDLTAAAVTTGSTAGLTYTYWTDAAATSGYATPTAATTGTYYIKGTTAEGCFDIQPVTVIVNPTPVVFITNPTAVCSPATVDLTAAAVTSGSTPGLTYTYWTNAAATAAYATPAAATAGTYYIKGTTPSGCYDIKPVTVTVNPTPVIFITNPAPVCSPATVDITAAAVTSGSTPGLTYTYWTDAAATAAYATPATAAAGTYYIKGTTLAGCYDIKPVTVTVNTTPTVVITNPAAVCSPATVDLTSGVITSGSTAGLTFSYWSDAAATMPYATPFTATAGTWYIKGTTAAGCYDIKPVTVTVNTTPAVVITNPVPVCSPATVDLTAAAVTSGSTPGLTYTYWTNVGATVAYATPATATAGTYYIKGETLEGCYDIKPVTVTVNPTPTVFITDPAAVCSPGTVNLMAPAVTSGSTPSLSYSYWTDAAATVSYPTPASATAGTYYIKGTTTAGCFDIKPVTVTINPTPTVVINAPAAVCSPATVDLTDPAVTSGSTAGLTFTYWTDAAATASYATPATATTGTYFIKGTALSGCYDVKPVTVTVNPTPVVVITNPAAVCSPATVDLTSGAITSGSTAGLTFSYWTDAAATISYATPFTATTGTYYIKGTTTAGCYDIKPVTVTVNPKPAVVITNPAAVCSPATVDLTDAAVTTGSTPGLTYTYWTNAAATVAYATPATAATGTYYIKGTTLEGCYDIKPVTVTINPTPVVVVNNPAAVCSPATVNLTAPAVTFGSTTGLTYTYWTDAAATAAYTTPAAATAGTYYIKGTAAAGCYDIKPVTVTVNPTPTVTITDPAAVCSPATVNLTAAAVTSGSTAGLTFSYWTDITATNPYFSPTIATAGTYYIKGTTTEGCYDIKPVTVIVNPTPAVVITNPASVCSPATVDITDAAVTSGSTPGLTYSYWTDAAATSAYATPAAATAGTYYIKGTTPEGCYDIKSVTVTVNPTPTVVITNPAATCSPGTVNLMAAAVTAGSTPGLTFSYWTDATATVSYATPASATSGTYYIKGTTSEGCYDIKPVTVTVNATPLVVITDPAAVCSPATVDITTAAVTTGSTPGLTYTYWTNAAATTAYATPASATAGTYYMKGTTADGCYDIKPVTVTVNPTPSVVITNPASVCSPATVDITAVAVTSGSTAGLTYTYWTDAAATTGYATPTTATAGTYYIKGTTGAGCYDIKPVTVTVNPTPTVIIIDPAAVCSPATVNLTAAAVTSGSTAGLTFSYWTDITATNPYLSPTIATAGTYYIKGTTPAGCYDIKPVTVTVNPTPAVVITNPVAVCSPLTVDITDAAVTSGSTPGLTYSYWTDAAATLAYATPAAATAGTYYIKGTTPEGCYDIKSVIVTVNPTPTVVITNPAAVCSPATVDLTSGAITSGSTPGLTFSYWADAAATVSYATPFNATTGTWYIKGTTAAGCYDIKPVTVTVNPTPTVTITNPDAVCSPATADITAAAVTTGSTPGLTYTYWTNAGATVAYATPAAATAGTYYIKGTTPEGCYDIKAVTVTVNPTPVVVINNPAAVCSPGTVNLMAAAVTSGSTPGLTYSYWTDAAATVSYATPATATAGTYYIKGITSAGCYDIKPVTVTVNPLPVASISGTATICPGEAAVVTVNVTTGASPYTVVLSDGTTIPGYLSGNNITVNPVITTSYTIASVTDANGCSITAPHANLTGTAVITVKSAPEIAVQPVDITVCEDDIAVFTVDAGLTESPVYQWYYDSGTGMQILTGETNATLSITAASALNGYRYQVIVSGNCPPALPSDIVTLTVKEKPEILSGPADVILCSGEDATLTVDAGVTTNPKYQWYVNTGSGWIMASGSRYQGTTTNTLTIVSVLEIMSGYQYLVRVSGDCVPYVETAPVTLTVTRQAEITQQPVSQVVCEGSPASFTVNAGLTTVPSYQWETSSDGGINWTPIVGATSATYLIASATTAMNNSMYRVVVSSSCGSSVVSQVVYLTVNELPEIATPPSDQTVCEGSIADFTVDAGNTSGAVYTWQISTDNGVNWTNLSESAKYFGVASPDLKINGALRTMSGYRFRVIVGGTCIPPVTSAAAILTVNTPPEILDQPDPVSICENENAAFTVSAQGTLPTYQWYVDQNDGNGYVPVTNTGVYTGANSATLLLTSVPVSYNNFAYRVIVSGGCLPPVNSNIAVLNVALNTAITKQPADSTICEFGAAGFDVEAVGADLTYQWQVYNGSAWSDVPNNGTYMGATTDNLTIFGPSRIMSGYRYRVVIGSKCAADITSGEAVLTINTSPLITDQPDNVKSCPGSTVTYSVTAEGTNPSYQWQVNSGSGFVNVTDVAPYSGTTSSTLTISNLTLGMNGYLVRVVVSGTCPPSVSSSYATLGVYAEPVILTQPVDADVCDGSTVVYYAQVYTTAAAETMQWQVDDGSGWADLAETSQYQGTKTSQLVILNTTTAMAGWHYRLQITGPCGNIYTNEVLLTVNQMPSALISPADTILVCGGIPTPLHGNPTGGSGTYPTHRWFGDVAPLSQFNVENPIFNTSLAGYYDLIYQVVDSKGCSGTDTVVVSVEKPMAMFVPVPQSGCQPLDVTFTNSSTGYSSQHWDFGDGVQSTDDSPVHQYTNNTNSLIYNTVTLQITSSNGCTDEIQSFVTVFPDVTSDFTFSDDTICSGETVTLSSLPGSVSYVWDFGDGSTPVSGANVLNHTYTNSTTVPVTYDVILTTKSFFGCPSVTTLPIVVYPTPVPAFTASPVSQTIPNATVTFTNGTNVGTWSWLWSFGDGNNSTDESPVYTYGGPGLYAVTLLVSNGVCSESITHSISILPAPPVADFDSIPSGCRVWSISPNNTSQYATSYYWEFGDGGISTAMNPVYTYTTAGTYRVTLTVTGPGGTDSKWQLVTVYPSPLAYFEISPSTVYVNDERIRCYNFTEGATAYIWEFGDGDTSHVFEPYHRYTTEGVYDVTLHAYSANGCYDTFVRSPAVNVIPFGDLSFATVFRPNQTGEIDLDELPTSGDEVNQFFYPPIRETVNNYHLQIFNRWGTLIYEAYDINRPWNGYYQHKLCPQGVYVWLVEGKYANGRPFKKVGDITLLH